MGIGLPAIAITGATGFIGRHLVKTLLEEGAWSVRSLGTRPASVDQPARWTHRVGDMTHPEVLDGLVAGAQAVVHLGVVSGQRSADNLLALQHLVNACRRHGVGRLVHISTAVVVGSRAENVIREGLPCRPRLPYERMKWEQEQFLARHCPTETDLVILRPTAVFGAGGRNLRLLCRRIQRDPWPLNYLRLCFHHRRKMNLIPVENVVAAIRFCLTYTENFAGRAFFVSNDHDPANHYAAVERLARQALDRRDYPLAARPLPQAMVRALLRCSGRTNSNPLRIYDGRRLAALGCVFPADFSAALKGFFRWYRATEQRGGAAC